MSSASQATPDDKRSSSVEYDKFISALILNTPSYGSYSDRPGNSKLALEVHKLRKRVLELEHKLAEREDVIVLCEVSREKAVREIKRFIAQKKEQGFKEIDDFEIMEKLKIPIEQVDSVLDILAKEGSIHE